MLRRVLLPTLAVTLAWVVLDFFLHVLLLGEQYRATPALWRPTGEMKMGVMYFAVFIAALAFTAIWHKFVRPKNGPTGLLYGVWFGLGHGISMGYGSYAVMPLTYVIALAWFLGSIVEGAAAGMIVAALVKE